MYKIGSVLRKVESCLIEMKNIDPIRKLEFAAIYQWVLSFTFINVSVDTNSGTSALDFGLGKEADC